MRNGERISHQSGWNNRGSGTQGAEQGKSVVPRTLK